MKIAACCITWNRPRLLERMIECFNRQDYQDRELIILDDAGQYPDNPYGEKWRVVSVNKRFPCIGAKRNACVELVKDADAIAIWDDDDIYMPWALSSCVDSLQKFQWAQARVVLEWSGKGALRKHRTFSIKNPNVIAYHGSWAYRRDAFWSVGGYPPEGQEDNPIRIRMTNKFGMSGNSTENCEPWYVYSRFPNHISSKYQNCGSFQKAWDAIGKDEITQETLNPHWEIDYTEIHVPELVHGRPW